MKPIGSLISGTMREEDLIPAFCCALRLLAEEANNDTHIALVDRIEKAMEDGRHDGKHVEYSKSKYFNTDESGYDLNEDLFYALNDYALPYCYFGAHVGDGSDYGWWLIEDFEEVFEGLKVSNINEVPENYVGEIAIIEDSGNVTLYITEIVYKEVYTNK